MGTGGYRDKPVMNRCFLGSLGSQTWRYCKADTLSWAAGDVLILRRKCKRQYLIILYK